jgi:hypothetical protein
MQASYDFALAHRESMTRIEVEIVPAEPGKRGELKARRIAWLRAN